MKVSCKKICVGVVIFFGLFNASCVYAQLSDYDRDDDDFVYRHFSVPKDPEIKSKYVSALQCQDRESILGFSNYELSWARVWEDVTVLKALFAWGDGEVLAAFMRVAFDGRCHKWLEEIFSSLQSCEYETAKLYQKLAGLVYWFGIDQALREFLSSSYPFERSNDGASPIHAFKFNAQNYLKILKFILEKVSYEDRADKEELHTEMDLVEANLRMVSEFSLLMESIANQILEENNYEPSWGETQWVEVWILDVFNRIFPRCQTLFGFNYTELIKKYPVEDGVFNEYMRAFYDNRLQSLEAWVNRKILDAYARDSAGRSGSRNVTQAPLRQRTVRLWERAADDRLATDIWDLDSLRELRGRLEARMRDQLRRAIECDRSIFPTQARRQEYRAFRY